jgi:hypothetical protein
LKVRTYSWSLFSKTTPPAKKPLMSRVLWCSYHPTVKSCWVLVYSVLLWKCCCRCCLALWDSTWLGAGMGGRGRVMASWMPSRDVYRCTSLIISAIFELWTFTSWHEQWFVILKPLRGRVVLINVVYSGLAFVWVSMHIVDPLLISKWFTGR